MICVGLSQALLAVLYCLEETFLSRVKIETQFFMGLQGVFGCIFLALCCVALRLSPASLSKGSGGMTAVYQLGHEDVLQGFYDFVHSTPLLVCFIVIVAASCLSVVSCVVTTQHASAACRLVLELSKIVVLWALGVYLNARSAQYLNWTLPAESFSSQSVVVALGLLISAIGQAVYHRRVAPRPCVTRERRTIYSFAT
jgi:hypothetical protein